MENAGLNGSKWLHRERLLELKSLEFYSWYLMRLESMHKLVRAHGSTFRDQNLTDEDILSVAEVFGGQQIA